MFATGGYAQICECLNCPVGLPPAGLDTCYTREFILNIRGATNDNMADPFQGICAVNVHFRHNYVWSQEMYLVSPGGDTLRLTGPAMTSGYASSALSTWNITFIPNKFPGNPDPGFQEVWDNDQLWQVFQSYNGTYHVAEGDLDDIDSGPVNGQWKIIVVNCTEIESAQFLNFSIVFCDETGIDCDCQAYGGTLHEGEPLKICEGDPSLELVLQPMYLAGEPDTTVYGYTYILSFNDVIFQVADAFDLRTYPPGKYEICGLSYDLEDVDELPVPDGMLTIPDLKADLYSSEPAFCGDVSNRCLRIDIGVPAPEIVLDTTLCAGLCLPFGDTIYCETVSVRDTFRAFNGCDSIVELHLTVLPAVANFLHDTICKGDFVIIGNNFYTQTGVYTNLLTNPVTGCDSLIILDLFVVELNVQIAPPVTLNCFHATSPLNATGSMINVDDVGIQWMASQGGTLLAGETELFAVAGSGGIYTLTLQYMLNDSTVCVDADSVIVTADPIQPMLTGPHVFSFCSGSTVNINSMGYSDASGLGGTFTYFSAWPPDPGNIVGPLITPVAGDSLFVVYQVGNCVDTLRTDFVEVAAPFATLKTPIVICNDDAGGAFNTWINFDTLVLSANVVGAWANTDLAPVSGSFPLVNFAGVPGPQSYTFTWTSVNVSLPCTNIFRTVEIFVENCACPSVATTTPGPFCVDSENGWLPDFVVTSEPGIWSITSFPPGSAPAEIVGDSLLVQNRDTGHYHIKYTLSNPPPPGCPDTSAHWFVIYDPPFADILFKDTVCNDPGSGSYPLVLDLKDLVKGGDTSGVWSELDYTGIIPMDTRYDFTNVPPGEYRFYYTTGEDRWPCSPSSYTVAITVLDCACPSLEVIEIDTLCNDLPWVALSGYVVMGGDGYWELEPMHGSSNPPSIILPDTLQLFMAEPGIYHLKFTLTDSPGGLCEVSDSLTLNLKGAPFATVVERDTVCNSEGPFPEEIDFSDLVIAGDASGQWTDLQGSGAVGMLPTLSFSDVAPGNYTFLYSTSSAQPPCIDKNYATIITVLDCQCPQFENILACAGEGDIDLLQGQLPGLQVVWEWLSLPPGNNPALLDGQIVRTSNADPGLYQLLGVIQNAAGAVCPDSVVVELTLVNTDAPEVRDMVVMCNESGPFGPVELWLDSLIIQSVGGTWLDLDNSGASGVLPLLNFEGVVPGTYRFAYVQMGVPPCPARSDTVTIVVETCDCPVISLVPLDAVCIGDSFLYLPALLLHGPSGSWAVEPSGVGTVVGDTLFFSGLTGSIELTYTLDIPPPAGCDTSASIQFRMDAANQAGAATDTLHICAGEEQTFAFAGLLAGADSGGQWTSDSLPGVDPVSGHWIGKAPVVSGYYEVLYMVSNQSVCKADTAVVTVRVEELPAVQVGADQIFGCPPGTIVLGDPSAPTGPEYLYRWYLDSIEVGDQPILLVHEVGAYVLEVTRWPLGCRSLDSVRVLPAPGFPELAGITITQPDCQGLTGSVEVTLVSGGSLPYLYRINGQGWQVEGLFEGLAAGMYLLEVEDDLGCRADTTLLLQAAAAFTVDLGPDRTVTAGTLVDLTATLTGNPGSLQQVTWQPGNHTCSDCLTREILVQANMQVTVLVRNEAGCEASDTLFLFVQMDTARFFIPNAISPNSDGVNDVLMVFGNDELELIESMEVFDRWGNAIFSIQGLAPNQAVGGWDGTYKGLDLNPGVFVYQMKLLFRDGHRQLVKGEVSLMR